MIVKHRYFLKSGDRAEREVTRDEYIALQRAVGFFPESGLGKAFETTDGHVGRVKTEIEE